MSRPAALAVALALLITALGRSLAAPPPAQAINVGGALCGATRLLSGVLGRACDLVSHGRRIISAGRKLLGGHVGQALDALSGASTTVHRAVAVAGLAAIAASVVGGARYALHQTAAIVSATTQPALASAWFGGAYWRMAAIALMLTIPLLLVAVAQAIIRSDLGLLARTAFGYLPLSGLAVGLAVPLTVLLLRGSDEMAALVTAGPASSVASVLDGAAGLAGLELVARHSVFLGFLLGLIACAMTLALWLELAVRQAAVTVIVLMLPLFFAALVWPARRIWAARALELLVSLVLSKFAIVAVLALGAAALSHSLLPGAAAILTGVTLVMLAAFSPWALLRILPLHELAAGAASGLGGSVSGQLTGPARRVQGQAALIEGDEDDDALDADGVVRPGARAAADGVDGLLGDDAALLGGPGSRGRAGPSDGADAPPEPGAPAEPDGAGAGARGSEPGQTPAPEPPAGPGNPEPDAGRWIDERLRRPRPGSDVDPVVHAAPNFSWRPIDLDLDEVLGDEPLLAPEDPATAPLPEPPEGEAPPERGR